MESDELSTTKRRFLCAIHLFDVQEDQTIPKKTLDLEHCQSCELIDSKRKYELGRSLTAAFFDLFLMRATHYC
jgi:hypothetical protein